MHKVLLALIFLAVGAPSFAQQPRCADTKQVMQLLIARHGEQVIESETRPAEDGSGPVLWAVWLNEDTGSWTLTGTRGDMTCVFRGALEGYSGETLADFLDGPAA